MDSHESPLNNPQESKVVLILGKRGSGKSFLTKSLLNKCNRFLIYDTMGEYTDGVIFQDVNSLIDFWKERIDKDFRLIYQPLQPQVEFDTICELVYTCGDMVFAAEEIDTFCTPQGLSLPFANVIQRGRHKGIDFVGVSQRPYGIQRIISSQAKIIYSFIQTEPRDVDYLKMFIGDEAEKVRGLAQYNFLKWDYGKVTISKL